MKHIIWSYKEGKYIEGRFQIPLEFDTESEAEYYVKKAAEKDVKDGIEDNLIEAIENGYLVEDIP